MLLGWYLSFSGSSLAVASACEFLDRGDSLLGRFAVLCLLAAVCLLLLAAVCLLVTRSSLPTAARGFMPVAFVAGVCPKCPVTVRRGCRGTHLVYPGCAIVDRVVGCCVAG